MQPESRFKLKVYRRLDVIPDLWYEKIQQVAIKGIPDLILCYRGNFLAWELKVGNNKATKLQQYVLDKISSAGGIARVVTPENLDEAIKELQCLVSYEEKNLPHP